jgi:hypothetical protein
MSWTPLTENSGAASILITKIFVLEFKDNIEQLFHGPMFWSLALIERAERGK